MNWKFNYWTVLCIVVVMGWVFSCTTSENNSQEMESNAMDLLSDLPPDSSKYRIKRATALKRYKEYKDYAKLFDFKKAGLAETDLTKPYDTLKHEIKMKHVGNPDVKYFHLPADGISQLAKLLMFSLQDSVNTSVYALLSLKSNTTNAEAVDNADKEVDLMFYVSNSNSDDDEGDFYDFTDPCPPTCYPPPPGIGE